MALTRVGKGALDKGVIKDQTNLGTSAADTDEYLLYDASTDSLKSIAASNVTPNETLITGKDALGEGADTDDQILIYDTSAGVLKKISQTNLLNFPTISSVSPTNLTSGDGTGNYTIVITGAGFTGATASLVTDGGTTVAFDTSTVDSDTQITGVIAKSSLSNENEPYDVRVAAATGLQSTLENQINIDAQPIFSTAAGSLGSERGFSTQTVVAADPESGGDITYTLESGSLPPGISLTSTSSGAVLSGTLSSFPASDTTYTFTIRAADVNSNTSDRQFTFTVLGPQVQSFTSSGTFSVPTGITSVEVLVVGGGGGSPDNSYNGGGGAGGFVYVPSHPITPGTPISVTVGGGGQGSPGLGGNSVFDTLTAYGGGGAGAAGETGESSQASGGGGGGGSWGQPAASGGSGGPQGNPGGSGNTSQGTYTYGGGGGGSSSAGQSASSSQAGGGGGGTANTITGSPVYYAGGGAGGSWDSNPSQAGKAGGTGSTAFRTAVTQNRGNGASTLIGAIPSPLPRNTGANGVVIVKY